MPTPQSQPRRWTPLPSAIHALIEANPNSILLETSRFDPTNHHSYIFLNPTQVLTATIPEEIPTLFQQIETAITASSYIAGYLSYEAAAHFEPTSARATEPNAPPIAHFGIYNQPLIFDHATGRFLSTPPELPPDSALHTTPILTNPTLRIPQPDYINSIARIKNYIAAGDTYQVNFTDAIQFPTNLSPSTLFTALTQQQSVAYAAFLNLGSQQILSLSPELFFRIDASNREASKITTRPMKGTMPRGLDTAEDHAATFHLQHDEKNRAEHVMIVDLLRNDLGRIAATGSVHVDGLFSIERYETLLQMTSTISATLRPSLTFYDIFRALFPCGSITGAPKIRTMQIIRELEAHPRGIYTGAIGFIAPNRDATFSVAIRTLLLRNGEAHMGVGGGIVADSIPEGEHREALLKANFLTRSHQPFQLIETMLLEPANTEPASREAPQQQYTRLPLHLDRLESSANYFNFHFDRAATQTQLQHFATILNPTHRHRVRLLLAPTGDLALTSQPLTPDPPTLTITLSPHRTHSADPFLRHKTTNRHLYDEQLVQARAHGFDEILFLNERNELTEGAISNLFLEISESPGQHAQFLTPPLHSGVLPGIMRRHLLETLPNAEERVLTLADLHAANAVYLCNSLRGLRKVTAIHASS